MWFKILPLVFSSFLFVVQDTLLSPSYEAYYPLYGTALILACIYFLHVPLKLLLQVELGRIQKCNPNLPPLRRHPSRLASHLEFTLFPNTCTFSSFLGISIAWIQFFTFGKIVNICVILLNLMVCALMTELASKEDREILARIKPLNVLVNDERRLPISSLRPGLRILLSPNEMVPVLRAKILRTGKTYQHSRYCFDISANTGESKTAAYFKIEEIVTHGVVFLHNCHSSAFNDFVELEILETYSNRKVENNEDRFTKKIVNIQSKISVAICFVALVLICFFKQNLAFLGEEAISCVILLNYLIPQMKTLPTAIIRSLLLKFYAKQKEINQIYDDSFVSKTYADALADTTYKRKITLICDKTGTLTTGNVKLVDFHVAFQGPDLPESLIPHFIGSINSGFERNGDIFANCSEEREIALFLKSHFACILSDKLTLVNTNLECGPCKFITTEFSHSAYGRHSLLTYENSNYHIIQFQSEQIAEILEEKWTPLRPERSMMIAYKKIPVGTYGASVLDYVKAMTSKTKLSGLRCLVEFYFEDPIRPRTIEAIRLLNSKPNLSIVMCTGDSITTALDIASRLGIFASNVHARCTSAQKADLIGRFQNADAQNSVLMFGDQKNDELALRCANFSFVQENGASECKIAAKCEVKSLWGVYAYLFELRRLRLFGQHWLLNQFHFFNCILAAISLNAIRTRDFDKNGILYLDPWNPIFTILLTNALALIFLGTSFLLGEHRKIKKVDLDTRQMFDFKKLLITSLIVFLGVFGFAFFYNLGDQSSSVNLLTVFFMACRDALILYF